MDQPVYVVSEVTILDEPRAARYRGLAQRSIAAHGGRYLVRGAAPEALEGHWPSTARLVIVEFPNVESARAWYQSREYAEALAWRDSALDRRLLLVEGGLPPQTGH